MQASRAVSLLFAVLFALVPLATPASSVSQAETSDQPAIPEPRPGDAGRYHLTHLTQTEAGWEAGDTRFASAFLRLDPASTFDAAGQAVGTDRVLEMQDGGPYPDQFHVDVRSIDPATGHAVAVDDRGFVDRSAARGNSEVQIDRQPIGFERLARAPGASDPYCGQANALQGEQVPADGEIDLFPSCHLRTETWELPEFYREAFELVATHPAGDEMVLVFETTEGRSPIQAWFKTDVPYPVRFVYPLVEGAAGDTEIVPGKLRVVDLHGFERAAPRTPGQAADDGIELPKIELAPRPAWGLPEGDLSVPFPASEAYEVALENDTFRDRLDRYPDVYPQAVDGRVTRTEGSVDWTWNLRLHSPNASFGLRVDKTVDTTGSEPSGGPMGQLGLTDEGDSENGSDPIETQLAQYPVGQPNGPWPLGSTLPDQLPTASSLASAWETAFGEPLDPNRTAWAFTVRGDRQTGCEAWSCTEPEIEIRFGEIYDDASGEGHLLDERVLLVNASGGFQGTETRTSLAPGDPLPTWVRFGQTVREELDEGERGSAEVHGHEHLPASPGSGGVLLGVGLLLGGIVAGGTVVWRTRRSR